MQPVLSATISAVVVSLFPKRRLGLPWKPVASGRDQEQTQQQDGAELVWLVLDCSALKLNPVW